MLDLDSAKLLKASVVAACCNIGVWNTQVLFIPSSTAKATSIMV